jgi:septin family protein
MKEKEKITYFAKTNFRNENRKFGIRKKDRRYHMYLVGKTGMGKSTMISNMIFSDLKEKEGLCLLDPPWRFGGESS